MSSLDKENCANCIYQSNSSVLSYCSLKQKYTEDDYVCRDHEKDGDNNAR